VKKTVFLSFSDGRRKTMAVEKGGETKNCAPGKVIFFFILQFLVIFIDIQLFTFVSGIDFCANLAHFCALFAQLIPVSILHGPEIGLYVG
jgi:hypothetical protein